MKEKLIKDLDMLWDYTERYKAEPKDILKWTKELAVEINKTGDKELMVSIKNLLERLQCEVYGE